MQAKSTVTNLVTTIHQYYPRRDLHKGVFTIGRWTGEVLNRVYCFKC